MVKKDNEDRIRDFVRQRCDNYKDDKDHMISSFLDKQKNTIVLDRVLTTHNGDEVLVTDPDQIMQITNHHFQTCAGGSNEPKTIPDNWQAQYQPKSDIDANIYEHLMTAPTLEEWSDVLRQLPKSKAAGTTKITNEMLQHLGSDANEILWKFVSACLRLNQIPNAWRKASI